MRCALAAFTLVAVTAHAAIAAPSIRLTQEQIDAAARVASAAIKPNTDRVSVCVALSATIDERDAATAELETGQCFFDAGYAHLAFAEWERLVRDEPSAMAAMEASHRLGQAYEAAGIYEKAVAWDQAFARTYPEAKDGRDRMLRAICMSEQLGRDDDAAKGRAALPKLWPRIKVDPAHLCDTIRPIPVVAP